MKQKLEALKEKILEVIDSIQVEWDLLLTDLKNKRITNRVRVFFALLSVLVLIIVGIVLAINSSGKSAAGESVSETGESAQESETDLADDFADEDVAEGTADSEEGAFTESDGGGLLPETDDAGEAYINNTLFIGDSNTVRMMNYNITSLDNTIAVVGMGIQSVKTLKCVQFSGYNSPVTMIDAVKLMQPQRIIITFGTNNANGMDVNTFIDKYEEALLAIHEAYSYADILINSIPPIAINNSYPTLKQSNIDEFNDALLKMSKRLGYKYIDSASVMKDTASGYAKNGYTVGDGIHISDKGFAAMFTYIRTHHSTVLTDKRPKPLSSIPKQIKATYVIDSSGKMNDDPSAYSKMSEVSKEQQDALKDLQEAALKAAQEALEAQKKAKITPTPGEEQKQEAVVTPTPKPENITPTPKPAAATPTEKPATPTEKPEAPVPTPTPVPEKPAEPTVAPKPEVPTPKPEEPAPTPVPAEPTVAPKPVPEEPEATPTPTPTPIPEEPAHAPEQAEEPSEPKSEPAEEKPEQAEQSNEEAQNE